MDPVSSLNSNTSQFYVAFNKDANITYAADTEKATQKPVAKTDEKSKSSGTETENEEKSKLEKETSPSYIVDIMDEDDDGTITTKEVISYYKSLAATKQEELDKQIKDSQTTVEEIKKETTQSKEPTEKTAEKTTENESKNNIVNPEERAKEIAKEIGVKEGENPNAKDIYEKAEKSNIIEENQKAINSTQRNKNLPSFMALENPNNNNKTSNVINIDKNQQEATKSPLEIENTPQNKAAEDAETVSPLEVTVEENTSATATAAATEEENPLIITENQNTPEVTASEENPLAIDEQENTQNNVYDINDYKLKKAVNSYQTVESNVTPFDYTSKISVNV